MSDLFVGTPDHTLVHAVPTNGAFSGRVAVPLAMDPVGGRLAAAGLSVTGPRRLVLAALEGRDGADTAADVCDLLRSSGTKVGLTTVYRILRAFSLVGLVHVFPGTEQRFRLCAVGPHVHLICERCGRVIEMPEHLARPWFDATRSVAGFVVDVAHTDIHGVCERCQSEAAA